ncbi:ameloblastin isoform X2 [Perognathus longimembris pacificus]|uniref:ameloblastin isoform X2 n=1 Tax=Perognathus longimembris pacificus TaxID=214514 RepID=UPI0020187998|nr:ameloblastin isoform X2 [Perognathus longimembris pacificus]
MSASKIPLFKMKDLILFLCLLKMSFAVPAFPQGPGTQGMAPPGMASLSLETMRQLGSLQGLNALSQYSRFGFGKALNSLWLHGLLPPPASFPWMRPGEHETQQPPLHPPQPGMKAFLQPTAPTTAFQATAQKGGPRGPLHPPQLPLQDGDLPDAVQQQQQGGVAPSEPPPTSQMPLMDFAGQELPTVFHLARLISRAPIADNKPSTLYPGMFYMSYGTNQLNTPARLGFMSSEEMPGARGPMAYGAMFPGFEGLRHTLRGLGPNTAKGGDFTLEFDSPVSVTKGTKGPEKGEEEPQGSPLHEGNPEGPALLSHIAPGAHAGLLAFPDDNIPSLARGPAGQRQESPGVTPATDDLLMTPELAGVYDAYGGDVTTPLGEGEATIDTTMSPDIQETRVPGNKMHHPQMVHDAWRFQEP